MRRTISCHNQCQPKKQVKIVKKKTWRLPHSRFRDDNTLRSATARYQMMYFWTFPSSYPFSLSFVPECLTCSPHLRSGFTVFLLSGCICCSVFLRFCEPLNLRSAREKKKRKQKKQIKKTKRNQNTCMFFVIEA